MRLLDTVHGEHSANSVDFGLAKNVILIASVVGKQGLATKGRPRSKTPALVQASPGDA
jgi:hypothetical protein